MYDNYQKDADELRAWIKEGEEFVEDGVATGPTGHLYVAVMNLLDYCNAETTTDEEVEIAMGLASQIMRTLS
jgi:hypothetical protein